MNEKFRADIAAASVLRVQQLKRQYAPPPKVQQAKPRPKIVRDPPDTAVPDSYRWKQVGFGMSPSVFSFLASCSSSTSFSRAARGKRKPARLSPTTTAAPPMPISSTAFRTGSMSAAGVFFGKSSLPRRRPMPVMEQPGAPLCSQPSHHTLIVARTRTGKGTRVIVPTLLKYRGSALVIDPKGENAAITARARQNIMPGMPTPVHIVNPWGELADHFQKLGFPTGDLQPARCPRPAMTPMPSPWRRNWPTPSARPCPARTSSGREARQGS